MCWYYQPEYACNLEPHVAGDEVQINHWFGNEIDSWIRKQVSLEQFYFGKFPVLLNRVIKTNFFNDASDNIFITLTVLRSSLLNLD